MVKLLLDRIMETCEANGHAVLNIRAKANLLIYLAYEDWFLWDSTTYLDTHLSARIVGLRHRHANGDECRHGP